MCTARLKLQIHCNKPANTVKMLHVAMLCFKDNPQQTILVDYVARDFIDANH